MAWRLLPGILQPEAVQSLVRRRRERLGIARRWAMGFDLNAFLGRTSELRTWKGRLPSAVVCELGGDLGLVPVTGQLFQELRARLGEEEANRLDAALGARTYPSASQQEEARRWGAEASAGAPVAYLSVGEFGDQGYEEATLWSGGREGLSPVPVRA